MKVLIIGGGGREHAIAWKIAQSSKVEEVFIAPGNAGTEKDQKIQNIAITDIKLLIAFAKNKKIDLTIVGPEVPLSKGIVDSFRKNNLKIFGPTKLAAQLESSKDFSKLFMRQNKIPTAEFATFTDINLAHAYVNKKGAPIVIKADGLAAGKGVVVATSIEEAHKAIDSMLSQNLFGTAGTTIIIEEFLEGEEASFIVICDGKSVLPLASSQDHKRLLNSDLGPNTGGMGAYSPAPIVTKEVHKKIMDQVITPTIQGMKKNGVEYTGFLYAGIMIDNDSKIKTLEFNCRMGDPETQPILFRMKSDLFTILYAAANQELAGETIEWESSSALTVVMAAKDYPADPVLGDEIRISNSSDKDSYIFHAGTILKNNNLITSGGRVLGVTAKGSTLKIAHKNAYNLLKKIKFNGAQYRSDIGKKALK
jgi:phosphoribosylamine--glycine ligase